MLGPGAGRFEGALAMVDEGPRSRVESVGFEGGRVGPSAWVLAWEIACLEARARLFGGGVLLWCVELRD